MKKPYSIKKQLFCSIAEAETLVTDALRKEGFGVLSRINMQSIIKEKLNQDMEPYIILGACNPQLAYKGVSAERELGLLLPCNVIIYQQEGTIFVSAVRPKEAMSFIENIVVKEVAAEVEEKLQHVINAL